MSFGKETPSVKVFLKTEQELSKFNSLNLPFSVNQVDSLELPETLYYEENLLSLRLMGASKPVLINSDFLSPKMQSRIFQGIGNSQPFIKALGKAIKERGVCDWTAGFCIDSFLLACKGIKVSAFERSPLVYALVRDGLDRFLASDIEQVKQAQQLVRQNFSLCFGDALEVLPSLDEPEEVFYLDPMFPEKKKTSLSSKYMQCLQSLVGVENEEESVHLLNLALEKGHRVVVKRPDKAPLLIKEGFSQSFSGKTLRFDMYLGKQ